MLDDDRVVLVDLHLLVLFDVEYHRFGHFQAAPYHPALECQNFDLLVQLFPESSDHLPQKRGALILDGWLSVDVVLLDPR